ncbi:MAG: DsbA family protein [Archangium sp.]
MQPPAIEFWFEFASTYSYLAAMRIEQAAAEIGAPLVWKPFLLGPLFQEQLGIKDSPFNVQPVRGRYMWRDMERLCEKYGLAFKRPSAFPRNGILAARLALLGAEAPWGPAFIRKVYEANFAQDRDISDSTLLAGLLREVGQDADALLAQAQSPEVKERLKRTTEEARQAGIFGAPDFRVGGELFFGHDRMDDALAWWRRLKAQG